MRTQCRKISLSSKNAYPNKQMSLSLKSLPQTESDHLYVLFNNGRYSELESLTRELIEQYPDSGVAWKALGASLQKQGKEALPALQRAAELLPDDAPAQSNLGSELRSLGQLDAAAILFRLALEIKPNFADAHNNLGAVMEDLGNSAEAVACYRRALEINPEFSEGHCNLGSILLRLGQLLDAEASFRSAIAITPDFLTAHNRLGVTLRRLGYFDAAAASHRRALEVDPNHASSHNNLGIALQNLGQFDAAMDSYHRTLEIDPANTSAYINQGCVLEELWQLESAMANFRRALELDPDSLSVRSSLLSLQPYLVGASPAKLLAEARQFGDLVARQAQACNEWSNIPDGARCLRVGLVSPDFHNHPVGHFLEGILAALSCDAARRLEIVAYTNNTHSDEVTKRLKTYCSAWHLLIGSSDESQAGQIRDDGIDILIDLSGHTVHNRLSLFAWKPAPVQVTWLGYFATTGVAAIDYLIADPWTLPESEEVNFTEKIWRLPETRLCFTPPSVDIDVAPLPALNDGSITFGSFQNPNKINDTVVALWARVLKAMPGSRLLLKTKHLDNAEVQQRVTDRFAAMGIESGRLILDGFSSRTEYLATYHRVDIVLDSFPFPGGTTTVESLWMGVPVLTMAGTSFLARQGVGLLMNAGLPDWIAANADDYVVCAVSQASDLPRLAALRNGLRQQVLNSPIFDAPRFAGHFEAALRGMWRAWCSEQRVFGSGKILPTVNADRLIDMFTAGRYAELETRTRSLIEQDPNVGVAWKFLGASLHAQGKNALPSLQKAAELLPGDAEVHNSLGNALVALGRHDDAMACYRRALAIKPDFINAHCNLGVALHGLGRFEEAVASYRRALAINPKFPGAHTNLGVSLVSLGRTKEAVASHRRAVKIAPAIAMAHYNLGIALQALGQFDRSLASFRRALHLNPVAADAHLSLGDALNELGHPEDALASYKRALEIKPDLVNAHANLLFTQSYLADQSAEMMLAQARRYGDMVERQARPYGDWRNSAVPNRQLRVGLVSGDLREHPVGHFIEGVLSALSLRSRERLSFIAYTNHSLVDSLTERIKASCHIWRNVMKVSDENLARQIREDGIDILIDLSGHTAHNRLSVFAWKPAPVQVTWLGYFATTGLAAMDYLLVDPWTLPESEEANFTEKIWRLPETRLCFTPPNVVVDVSPLPALTNGYITFGGFHSLNKINDAVVALWARVLHAVPGSRLLLKAKLYDQSKVRKSVASRFTAQGIDVHRLIFEGSSPRVEYLAAYQRVDIVLDTFPYPGGTTTVECLWMGVPVLTLAGNSFLSRQGLGLLMNAGLTDWIAADADDYVVRAMAHVGDLPRLAILRAALRQQVLESPIFDALRFAGHFETALRHMWQSWCQNHSYITTRKIESKPMKTFLHVGCGSNRKAQTTRGFNVPEWRELRLDIDSSAEPDIVGTMLDMSAVAGGSVDALFSAHNIEHLYAHEVPLALAEFLRVLTSDGFLVITCPDLQSVCQLIAEDKLLEPAYQSPAGPVTPLDILFGLRSWLQQGHLNMAHRCGFTENALVGTLQEAGFGSVISGRRSHPYYDLWAVASKAVQSKHLLGKLAEAHFPDDDESESATLPPADEPSSEQTFSFSSHTYWGVSDRERFSAAMEEAKSLVSPGYFLGDNLFTWCRNNSMLEDAAFRHAWQSNIQNDADEAIVWRRYILACAAYHCLHLQGDFVECGVYSGTGIKTVTDYLGGTAFPKTFWGYDTYDYHPVAGHEFPGQQEGFFETVRERFAAYPQVKLIKGFLPDSFAAGIPEAVSYLHIDLNNAAGELATLEHLFDRMVPGGIIILDDYEWSGVYRQQKKEEDPWFAERNYRVFPLPTGQGLVIKR